MGEGIEVGEEEQARGKIISTNTHFAKTEASVSGYHALDNNILQ